MGPNQVHNMLIYGRDNVYWDYGMIGLTLHQRVELDENVDTKGVIANSNVIG